MYTYRQTLDFLYTQLPMFQRIGAAAFRKDLNNTLALCAHLGQPHLRFPSLHVGGTNGKGSVSHMLAAVCQTAGLKTGLYTSPHYRDFRERIKINGRLIPKKDVVRFVADNQPAIERIKPSFFEMTVAMAFDYFAREKVDIAVVEVGLGGRLDSTNVITPLLSVITNISYDHMDLLGDTLEKIAAEKAGIIKTGVPVVVGETHPETEAVFRNHAQDRHAPIFFADQAYRAEAQTAGPDQENAWTVYRDGKPSETIRLDSGGPYQSRNLVTVLQACSVLEQTPAFMQLLKGEQHFGRIRIDALARFRELTRFIGRWQIIGRQPLILCDSAHNEAGIRTVCSQIQNMPHRRLHIVTGFANDKDLAGILGLFPTVASYYFAKANVPRGLDAATLRERAAGFGLSGKAYVSVRNALKAARRAAAPDDLILVTGSIFVVAEVV